MFQAYVIALRTPWILPEELEEVSRETEVWVFRLLAWYWMIRGKWMSVLVSLGLFGSVWGLTWTFELKTSQKSHLSITVDSASAADLATFLMLKGEALPHLLIFIKCCCYRSSSDPNPLPLVGMNVHPYAPGGYERPPMPLVGGSCSVWC